MREIKFRAWEPDQKRMYDCNDFPVNAFEGSKHPIMQYTGLHDKNGKEIYEGDILTFTEVDEDSAFGREETNTVLVKWIEDIAQYRAVFQSGRRVELHFVLQLPTIIHSEVIGNIYENPDLLTKDKQP